MKNIKKAIKQLIEFDRTLSILYIGMIFMVLAGIIMAILPVPAEAAIPVIVVLGMLMVIIIAANMSSEIEKKHRKKVRLKCVYSNKKKKVNIFQGSIQYRGMNIPCKYKLDISE